MNQTHTQSAHRWQNLGQISDEGSPAPPLGHPDDTKSPLSSQYSSIFANSNQFLKQYLHACTHSSYYICCCNFRRRNVLLVTSTLLSISALVLGALVLTGVATVAIVMAMAFVVGCIAAFDGPARQAM